MEDFDIDIKELKVFKGNYEVTAEEEEYSAKLNHWKRVARNNPISQLLTRFNVPKRLPLTPFPQLKRCLGVELIDGKMEVVDGFARMAFNF